MVSHVCNLEVGEFLWYGGDCHIYNNHIEQVKEQLSRTPLSPPQIKLNRYVTNIDDFIAEDIELVNYNPHPAIKGKVSV